MAVVRELVTRLGFQFDRTNLDRAERSILGFKTRITIAAASIGAAIKKTFDFASDIANAAVSTKDLADYAGIAVNEFAALKSAAEKLSIKPEKFEQAVQKLAIQIKEASRGAGELFEIVKQTQGKINFRDANNQLLSVKDVLFQIFDYIQSISDRSEQLRILGNIFDVESAGAWLRAIEKGKDSFIELVNKEKEFGKSFEQSIPALLEFQNDLSILNREWEKLTFTIGKTLVPILGNVVKDLNTSIDTAKNEGIFAAIADALDFSKLFTSPEQQLASVQAIAGASNSNSTVVNNNNKIEITVPPGTTEQQASYIGEQLKISLQSFWDEKTREVINNSPQVE